MTEKTIQTDPVGEQIMENRAQKLAQPPSDEDNTHLKITVVEFRIAHEIYALGMKRIRIIHPLKDLTWIPGTPEFIRGVINLRGEIISVVDLKVFFDLPDQELTGLTQVIILSAEDMEFGILADEICGVTKISKTDIQPSLPTLTGIRADYLKGVTAEGTVVLDDKKLLSDKKMCIDL